MRPVEPIGVSEPTIWQVHYPVRSYEVDARGWVSALSLCNFFQDAASSHAHALGVSVAQLAAENLTWMLYGLHLRMEAYCRWQETVTLTTWPSGSRGLFALREFTLDDSQGRRLGAGFSQWLAIDLAKRRPVRIAPIARRLHPLEGRFALDHDTVPLRPLTAPDHHIPVSVGFCDLDLNQHVNNVRYIQWVLETLPIAMRQDTVLAQLHVQFQAEAFAGQRLEARRQNDTADPLRFGHDIRLADTGKEIVRAATRWTRM
jgi:acyl-ACP thioesterase